MRKIRFTIMAAVMAAIFITSGCVKNEESEGVKELRKGQAALLQARASATTMEAEAEAAYYMSMAAFQEAIAQIQIAYARQTEIANELQEAKNEITIAELQLELEVLQATQEYEIAVAVANAQELLNAAEISLMASIRELEKAIAENDNALLKEYLDLYKDAMAEVLSVRDDIIDESAKLARYQIYVDGYDCGDLVAEKLREQEKLENEVALMEIYKAKLEEVIGDPSLNNEELAGANKVLDSLNMEMGELSKQQVALEQSYSNANYVFSEAQQEYNDTRYIISDHPGIIEDWTNTLGYGAVINVETVDLEANAFYSSKATYEEWIANAEENIALFEEDIAEYEVILANQQEVYDVHAAQLAVLYAAYVADEAAYQTAQQAFLLAEAELAGDPADPDLIAAYDAALLARNTAETEKEASLLEHNNYKANYYDPALAAVEFTQGAITSWEGSVTSLQEDIAGWLAEHAIVIAYIAYLQAELDGTILTFDDVRTAYFTAMDALEAASDAYFDDFFVERDLLLDEIMYAEWYLNVLVNNNDSQIAALDSIIEDIALAKAAIAELDVTFASWESAIAAQQAKIGVLEAELAYWEAVAADYKVMFEGQMGDE